MSHTRNITETHSSEGDVQASKNKLRKRNVDDIRHFDVVCLSVRMKERYVYLGLINFHASLCVWVCGVFVLAVLGRSPPPPGLDGGRLY